MQKNTKNIARFSATLLIGGAAGIAVHEGVRPALAQPESESEMSPEEMMEQWAQMGQPGEHHERLDRFVGSYDVSATFDMPGGETIESDGSLDSGWILDGRWIHGDFRLDNMMGPYQGISYVGYDNQKGEYVSIWLDSMSTKAYVHEARFEGEQFIIEGEGSTGPMRIVSTPQDDGGMLDEFYEQKPDGEWHKTGQMTYTRK